MTAQNQAQGQLTEKKDDKDPFRKKQQMAKSNGEDRKKDDPALRADVPDSVAAFLKLTKNDSLEWRADVVDGEKVAIVRKKEQGK